MLKGKLLCMILLGFVGCSSGMGQATMLSIPIVDPDFESQAIAGYIQDNPPGCGINEHGKIAGWTTESLIPGGTSGVAHWTCDDGAPNSNVAFLEGAAMEQILTEKARNGTYVLQFDIGSWFYSYSGDWLAALFTGKFVDSCPSGANCIVDATSGKTILLSQAPFCSSSGWSLGDMRRATVTCNMSGGFVNPGNVNPDGTVSIAGQIADGFVVIHFQNGVPNPALGGHDGWPILIDNVSLTFTAN